jgi:PAS domain S-box-containing protein
LEALLQSCPDAIISIDAEGTIRFANNAACELLVCQMTDLIGKNIVIVYENGERAREANRMLYQSGGVIHDHETVCRTKTGKLVPVRLSAAHIYDSSGNYTGGVGFFQAYRPWTAQETRLQDRCELLEARLSEWEDLGAPVFEFHPGLSMAVVVGRVDSERFAHLKTSILNHIKVQKTRVAIIDLSAAVAGGDGEVAAQLVKLIRMIRVVGAECVIVGIQSTRMAEAIESLVADVSSLNTFSSLQVGMQAALAMLDLEISRKQRE